MLVMVPILASDIRQNIVRFRLSVIRNTHTVGLNSGSGADRSPSAAQRQSPCLMQRIKYHSGLHVKGGKG